MSNPIAADGMALPCRTASTSFLSRIYLKIFAFIICLVWYAQGFSQPSPKLPSMTTLAPEAASLSNFAEIPVNYYSGVPAIAIPLYSQKALDNMVNLYIAYHAGGIRVDEEASATGLGWSLVAGGIITQKEGLKAPTIPNGGPCSTISNSIHSYQFNFDQYSGVFSIDNQTGKGTAVRQSDLDIQELSPAGTGFKIITPDGYIYMFTEKEEAVNSSDPYISWKLATVTSPNGNVVTYEYDHATEVDYTSLPNTAGEKITGLNSVVHYVEVNGIIGYPGPNDNLGGCNVGPSGTEVSISGQTLVCNIKTVYLKRISFNVGYIDLNYEDRTDLNHPGSLLPKRLKEIVINSFQNNIAKTVKKFSFLYDYSDYNGQGTVISKRLRLRELREYSADAATFKSWAFDYNSISLPLKTSKDKDHWGFYNGPVNNVEIFPISGANRECNPAYVTAGMLQSITYPTGGVSQFEFESNDYSNRNSTGFKKGGGVRIKKITTQDGGVTTLAKRFVYETTVGGNAVSSGILIYDLNYSVPRGITEIDRQCNGTRTQYSPQCDCYVQVPITVRFTYSIAYISNYEQPKQPSAFSLGPAVGYSKVTVYDEGSVSNGRTIYEYINDEAPPQGAPVWAGYYLPPARLDNGYLIKKTEYLHNGGTSYTPVKMEENEYELVNQKIIQFYMQDNILDGRTNPPGMPNCQFSNYDIRSNPSYWVRLKKNTVTNYSADNLSNSLVTTATYTYKHSTNPKNFLVDKVEYVNSKQENASEDFKYPEDFSVSSTVYQNLVSRNIYSPVVEFTRRLNGVIVTSEKTNYKNDWYPDLHIVGQDKNESAIQTGPFSENFRVHAYDQVGNITSFSKTNNHKNTLLWDHNGAYPVAQVVNADHNDVAFTSFETDNHCNWNGVLPANIAISIPALTGRRYYNPAGSSLTKTITPGKQYIVSYWSRSGSLTVSDNVSLRTGISLDGWIYYEHVVMQAPGGSGNISVSGSALIDELRLYPKSALMTTYTHEPLIGILSKCDPNNLIEYYDYDSYGRLVAVRDQDKNIVKKLCYNYAGQPETCPVYKSNYYGNYVFRNNCTPPQVGTAISVAFPAGLFTSGISQAAADGLAWAQSQQMANAQGRCIDPVYGRLEIEHAQLDEYTYENEDYINQYVDVYLRFYSDAACTQPFTLTKNLNIGVLISGCIYYLDHQDCTSSEMSLLALMGTNELLVTSLTSIYGKWNVYDAGHNLTYMEMWDQYFVLSPITSDCINAGTLISPSVLLPPWY